MIGPGFQCRSCGGSQGSLVLDLGVQPLANNLLRKEDLGRPEPKFPLRVAVCESCWLMQILDTVPPVELFSEYLYFSSFSQSMLSHAKEAANRYAAEFKLRASSLVVEVASNDGYLLKNFVAAGVPCLGIEPAANIAKVAGETGVETLVEFFGPELAMRLARENRQADLILGNNVFAHVPEPNGFVEGIRILLKPQGVAVLEFPYGVDFIEHNEFDTVYHEHVFYFTLTPLMPLFERHGLQVSRVERIPIHGGSLRLFVAHKDAHSVDESVGHLAAAEQQKGISSSEYYEKFAKKVAPLRNALRELIQRLKAEGKCVAAYGASAKGSTLLNYYGIGAESLEFVADRSTYKQGRFTPGMHIPILPAEALLERMPDYTLLLTWNFADEIIAQQKTYRERGGKFIVPIPEVRIV
ncbi:MAG TPA: class I SAM-dependent methyltransferase [Verrucomicrobiae bacterium]